MKRDLVGCDREHRHRVADLFGSKRRDDALGGATGHVVFAQDLRDAVHQARLIVASRREDEHERRRAVREGLAGGFCRLASRDLTVEIPAASDADPSAHVDP